MSAIRKASLRVLLIEDDKSSRDATSELLRCYGHAVEVMGTGRGGIERALHGNYDAVVVGLGTPSCEWWRVASRLKRAGQTCPLIGVTAWADREHQRRAQQAGFDRIVLKPIDPEKFFRTFPPGRTQVLAKRGAALSRLSLMRAI